MSWNWEALSAIGTLLAVVVSLLALGYQRHREYLLRLEEEDRQRRAQAGFISVWYDDALRRMWVENRSEQPIYDAAAGFLLPRGQPAPDGHKHIPLGTAGGIVRILPPHHRALASGTEPTEHPVPVLAFRDAQGTTWTRDQHGNLEQLSTSVFEHFGVTSEHGYLGVILEPI